LQVAALVGKQPGAILGGAAMAKKKCTGDFASRGDGVGFCAAANTTTKAIDCVFLGRRLGRADGMVLSEILLAVSLILSLLIWHPAPAWSQQGPHDNFDRRDNRAWDNHQQVVAESSAIALTSRRIEPGAAILVLDNSRRLAERAAAPNSAMVLPLVQPSGPSGAAVVTSVREFLGLARIKTGLLLLHLLGLVLGVGTATLLDLFIARSLHSGRFSEEQFEFIAFASRFVFAGILLLWISGLSFLLYYYFENPTGLENPKVWAKITIVAILSLNGFYIHKAVLPELKRNAGFSVFHGTSKVKRSMMLVSGAVSVVSWYAPLVIGTAKELSFTVSAQAILIAYSVALALAILGSHFLYALLASRPPSSLENTTSRDAGSDTRQSTRGAIPAAEGVQATGPLLASS